MPIRLLLVEDHEIVREGLLALLKRQSDVEVVATAADGRDGVRLAQELRPDVIVMDIGLPKLNGIDATKAIRAESPDARIIVLTVRVDDASVKEAFRAGASGYLLKECGFHELQSAIALVMSGKRYLSPYVSGTMIDTCFGTKPAASSPASPELSTREREVLQLIAEGLSTKEIAAALHVSVKTVETHRTRIMGRLNLHNVAQLTRYAVRAGLTG